MRGGRRGRGEEGKKESYCGAIGIASGGAGEPGSRGREDGKRGRREEGKKESYCGAIGIASGGAGEPGSRGILGVILRGYWDSERGSRRAGESGDFRSHTAGPLG